MKFTFDALGEIEKIDKHWNFSIGSCHAATALREDYRRDLRLVRKELGIRYLRFHGLFDDDMYALRKSLTGEFVISFTNIDSIFDFLTSIGMKPFVELSFMPTCIASGDMTIFPYKANVTPPKDEQIWSWFIDSFVRHMIERYGLSEVRTWYFEIWNEPNLGKKSGINGAKFFSGDMDDYFRLYALTAKTVKAVDSRLKVGGPATSNNAWIPETLEFCRKNGVPIDFISTHHYPTDIALGYGVEDSINFTNAFNEVDPERDGDKFKKLISEYVTFQSDIWKRVDRGVLTDMARRAKTEADGLPLFYTEWSSLAGIHTDGAFGASFAAKTALDNIGIVDGSSYWTFSDIIEEKGMPSCAFHGGFGLMNYNGIKKAPYNAFALLNKLSDTRYKRVMREGNVDIYAFRDDAANAIQLFAINHNSLLHDIDDEEITIAINGAELLESADIWRVDDENANAVEHWKKIGAPQYLDKSQIYELQAKGELKRGALKLNGNNLRFTLPKQGVAYIVVYKK